MAKIKIEKIIVTAPEKPIDVKYEESIGEVGFDPAILDEELKELYYSLCQNQEPLDEDLAKIINENMEDLYE